MALVATLKASGSVDDSTSPTVDSEILGAITFAAGSHVVVCLGWLKAAGATSYTDWVATASGLTFTEAAGQGSASNNVAVIRILAAPHTAGGSTTITLDSNAGTSFGLFYAIYEVTGQDTGDPTDATASEVQSAVLDGSYSITLNATPASDSVVIAAFMADTDVGTNAVDVGSPGWVEDAQVDTGGSFFGVLQTQQRTGSTSTTVNWADIRSAGSTPLFSTAAAAVEFAASPAPAGDANQWTPRQAVAPVPRVFRTGIRAPLQLMGSREVAAAAVNATVTGVAIVTTTGAPAPTLQTGSTVTGVAIVTTAALPAPTVQTGSTVAATAVVTSTAMPAPTVVAVTLVAPPVIATVAALPAPAVQTGSVVSATTIVTTTAMPAPTVIAATVAPPAVIGTTAALPAPTVQTGSTVAATAIATTTAMPAPTVVAATVVAPAAITTTAAMPAPTVQTGSTVAAVAVDTAAAMPAASVLTAGAVDSNQAGIQIPWMFVLPEMASLQLQGDASSTVAANATVTATAITTTTAMPAPAVQTGSTVAATALATVTALPAPTVQTGSTVSATSIATVTALPAPSIQAGGGVTVAATAIATVTTLPAPAVQQSQTVSGTAIATVTALPVPAKIAETVVSPVSIATVTALPAPTVQSGSTVGAGVIATVTALPLVEVQGTASGIQGNVYPPNRAASGSVYPRADGGIIGSVA